MFTPSPHPLSDNPQPGRFRIRMHREQGEDLVCTLVNSPELVWDSDFGPVLAGPALSRGRVYVGGGNTLWSPSDYECFFPKQYTGAIRCFGLRE